MLNLIAYNGLALSVIYFGALIFLIPSNGNGDHLYVAFVTGALPLFGLGLVSIVSMRKTLLPTLLMYLFAILTI